ncbi:MAG TPA: metallophosphoesterase [Terracidiphilus sp.]|nr:metallophosphoesterase [Terracidiphilus sp.]
MKAWPTLGILIVQTLLCLAHWFLYCTWIDFWFPMSPHALGHFRIMVIVLSASFIVAALLGFRFTNFVVAFIYQLASVWLGILNYLFFGACLAWLLDLTLRVAFPGQEHLLARPYIAAAFVVLAVATSVYGIVNARIIRIRRVSVALPNLPAAWSNRVAMVFSDIHLGNINGLRFARRIANLAQHLQPDIIFIPGDLFDGTRADPSIIAAPFFSMRPSLGTFFVAGNHEEFGGSTHYTAALRHGGFNVLEDAQVNIDGLKIIGTSYSASSHPMRHRHFLMGLHLSPEEPSILLQHVPHRLPVVEQAGVSLMLSGHTHSGQILPFSWITRRAFGKFTYGLQSFGTLQVYTSSGAGTWGPPMRVGTSPEVVLVSFRSAS